MNFEPLPLHAFVENFTMHLCSIDVNRTALFDVGPSLNGRSGRSLQISSIDCNFAAMSSFSLVPCAL